MLLVKIFLWAPLIAALLFCIFAIIIATICLIKDSIIEFTYLLKAFLQPKCIFLWIVLWIITSAYLVLFNLESWAL